MPIRLEPDLIGVWQEAQTERLVMHGKILFHAPYPMSEVISTPEITSYSGRKVI